VVEHVTFNHGVEGSSPSALTKEINHLDQFRGSAKTACACAVSANELPRAAWLRLRRAVALPINTLALILSFLSDALGTLAARIAGDDWPR
jgi:hypothetical protein